MYYPNGVWWTIVAFMVGHDTIDGESRGRWFDQMVNKVYRSKSMWMWRLNLDVHRDGERAVEWTRSISVSLQHMAVLGQYPQKDLVAFNRICDLIKCCPKLKYVGFQWLRLTDGILMPQLIGILESNKSIRTIDVVGNKLTDFDVLTDALNGNKSIKRIIAHQNQINKSSGFIEACVKHPTVTTFGVLGALKREEEWDVYDQSGLKCR